MKDRLHESINEAFKEKWEIVENILRKRIKKEFGISIKTPEKAKEFFKSHPELSLDTKSTEFGEILTFRNGNKIYDVINIDFKWVYS